MNQLLRSTRPFHVGSFLFLTTVVGTGPGASAPASTPPAIWIAGAADTVEVPPEEALLPKVMTANFPGPTDPERPLMVLDPRLEERIVAMAERSIRWLEGLLTFRAEQFPVLVGTIVQVEERLPALGRYRYDAAAGTWIFSDRHGRPVAAAVAINLPKLVLRNRVLGLGAASLHRMIELHLAHEIYGHLVPIVESGDLEHPCRFDPAPDASTPVQMESCVMNRESDLLADLGYQPREAYRWHFWEEAITPLDP